VSQNTFLRFRTIGAQPDVEEPAPIQPAVALEEVVEELEEGGWVMKVGVEGMDGKVRDEGKLLGMVSGARREYDGNDWFQPPVIGGLAVYFVNSEGAMERDFRPIASEGDYWELKVVGGEKPMRVRMKLEDVKNFLVTDQKAFLVDMDQKMAYDLRKTREVELTTAPGGRNFRIVVGTKEYVSENSGGVELIPTKVQLFGNYPNPFNPETILRYTIPEGSHRVSLRVYNVIGQEVEALVDEMQEEGYYERVFRAVNLPSGTYLCRLTVTNLQSQQSQSQVRKMMLVK
jgi:hypothetical protein